MLRWCGGCLLWAVFSLGFAGELKLAVAANVLKPAQQIVADFERVSGHKVVLSSGATGKFYAQIRHGAPFEVLLAADTETPQKLEAEGLAVAGSRFTYARGRLALWSAQPGAVDGEAAVLRTGVPKTLAIANPRLAPYGRAAQQTLERMGVLARWQGHLVQGENIAQTHQFVASGNAALGLVALSQVMVDSAWLSGSGWVVPERWHDPIEQEAVLLKAGASNPVAAAFLVYLKSAPATSVLRRYGYGV